MLYYIFRNLSVDSTVMKLEIQTKKHTMNLSVKIHFYHVKNYKFYLVLKKKINNLPTMLLKSVNNILYYTQKLYSKLFSQKNT